MSLQRLVTTRSKKEMVMMLYGREITSEGFYTAPWKEGQENMFKRAVDEHFPDADWKGLCRKMHIGSLTNIKPIAHIDNTYAFRNGNNLSQYNYAICIDREFKFRQTIDDTVTLLRIMLKPVEELPLLIGTPMCKVNKELFDKKLKGGC